MEPSFVWMRSGKLRNPMNPRVPQRMLPRQEVRPTSSTSSHTERKVKTTTSYYWFAHSELPTYIRSQADETVGQPAWSPSGSPRHLNKQPSRPGSGRRPEGTENDRERMKSRHKDQSHKRSRGVEDFEEEDQTMLELCPNVHRRSSYLAGLRSVRDRLAPTEAASSPDLQTKRGHNQRHSERSQPRTSSARGFSKAGVRPGSDVGSAGGSTASPRTGSLSPWTESEVKPSEVSWDMNSPGCPSERKIHRSSVRPLSAVQIAAKAKRLIDERLRTMYKDRRIQSATYRRRGPTGGTTPYTERPKSSRSTQRGTPTKEQERPKSSKSTKEQERPKSSRPRSRATPQTPFTAATPQSLREEDEEYEEEEEEDDEESFEEEPVSEAIARFRKAVHQVVLVLRVMGNTIDNCLDSTPRSATELQWLTIYAEREDTSLTFNKHLFSRERVITHVPEWAKEILAIPPVTRTHAQCRRLHALLRGLKSFDKFTDDIQMSLCRAFTMARVEEQRVVLKKGHVGINFYFIYSGSVFVNVDDTAFDGSTFVSTIAVLARGDSFGELALLQDIRRTATITVRERCELLVVERSVFASVCPAIFERELEEKYKFVKNLSLFWGSWWTNESLWEISMNSHLQEFKTNKVIAANSALEDWIYACVQGCCQLIRSISLDRPKKKDKKHGKKNSESEIVLSEEILQLLSSAAVEDNQGPVSSGDTKGNLLTSLGLEYTHKGKKSAAMLDEKESDALRARLGLTEGATTLTALMKRQRQILKKDLIYLNVGRIGPGDIFDIKSITEQAHPDDMSCLMLISGGAKVLKIRKGIFYEHASHQAMEHTRTLASKEKNPSEDVIFRSYGQRAAWEDYKDSLLTTIRQERTTRTAPLFRDPTVTHARPAKGNNKTRLLSALKERSKTICGQMGNGSSYSSDSGGSEDESDQEKSRIQSRMGETETIFEAIVKDNAEKKRGTPRYSDLVVVHRKLPPPGQKTKVAMRVSSAKPVRPYQLNQESMAN